MDVEKTARTVTIRNPAKNDMSRQIRVSEKYINILDRQPQNGIYVFYNDPETILRQTKRISTEAKGIQQPKQPTATRS
jgi:hypothetical protein